MNIIKREQRKRIRTPVRPRNGIGKGSGSDFNTLVGQKERKKAASLSLPIVFLQREILAWSSKSSWGKRESGEGEKVGFESYRESLVGKGW